MKCQGICEKCLRQGKLVSMKPLYCYIKLNHGPSGTSTI